MATELDAITVVMEEVVLDEVGRQTDMKPQVRTFTKEKADPQPLIDWLLANGYAQTHGDGLIRS